MLVRAKKNIALRIVTLVAVAILLPIVSLAATSPTVSVLSPLSEGLRTPVKMALDAAGNIYVADTRIGGVVKFNTYGVKQMVIPTSEAPSGLAFAIDGTLLVSQGSSVVRYDAATGQVIGMLAAGNLVAPAGIAVDDVTGYIYVVDRRANQVVIFTASGDYVKAFAQGITSDAYGNTVSNPLGLLSRPSGITFEKVSRQFAVADTFSNRVQFFDVDGNFVKSIGNLLATNTTGSTTVVGPMQFDAPVATTFEYSNDQASVALKRIYIVDTFQGNIQVVDPVTLTALNVVGTSKNYIGSPGVENGKLTLPADAFFDAANKRLMVVNGNGNVTIYGIDGGTNPFDAIPPALSIDPVPATVPVPSVTVSGTVEAGAAVSVTVGGTAVAGSVVYPTATTWKCSISGLNAGSNTITVTAMDAAGNAAAPQSVNVVLQVPAPVLIVSSSVPALTKVREIVISGTVDQGSTVTVTNNSTAVTGVATVIDNNWTYRVDLAEGPNSFAIAAQKPLSAFSAATVLITLDTTPPALTVSTLSDGSYTSNQVLNVTGSASDAGVITVLVNNVPATLVNGSFSVPVSLVTGINTITVEASDVAGNVSNNSRTLYFDASKPQISIAAPMDNSYTNTASLQISGTVDKVASITVAGIAAAVDSNNNWSADIELVNGINTIEVIAVDRFGNVSTLKRSVTLDSAKPILAISSPVQDIATNQSSVTIAGTVSDEDEISLTYSVNGKITTVPVDAGSFSFQVALATEGVYQVLVTATDLAGNSTMATRSVIYDVTAPTLTIDPVLATVSKPAVTVGGVVEAGASVAVTVSSTATAGSIVYPTATTWKCDITALAAGNNTITVFATDAAGNSVFAQPVDVSYQLPAPSISIASVPSLTNERYLVVGGIVDEGATVTVTNESTSLTGTATVTGSTWNYSVSLAEGPNVITVTAQKPMSVVAAIKPSQVVTLDSFPPVLAVSAVSDGSYTSNQIQNITGTVSDANAVTVLVNNQAVSLANGSFSVPVSMVTGKNTITVAASDAAGNVVYNSRTLYFDATKPQIFISAPMDNSYTNNASMHISGTVDKVASVTVAGVSAIVDNDNNWSADITLVSGANTIEVVATDLYGNSSTLKRSVTLDTIKPVLAVTSPTQDIATNQSILTMSGVVNDNDAISLAYLFNGKVVPVPVDTGNFSFNINFSTEGVYPVEITVTDYAGNSTTVVRSVLYDVTPPVLTLDKVKWQTHALGGKIGGTVDEGATVTVKDGSTSIGVVTVVDGKWTADLSGLSYNPAKLVVTAVDAAGNSTSKLLKDYSK